MPSTPAPAAAELLGGSGIARVSSLDGWRGTAILALLVGHFVPGFGVTARFGLNCGRLGVELFFVLSGLLMGQLLFVKQVGIPIFYKKRLSRIFPALYIYLATITVGLWLTGHGHSLHALAAIFLLYFNYYAGWVDMHVPQPYQHIWSLCIEEHSYVILSLVALLCRRTRLRDYRIIGLLTLASWGFAAAYTFLTDWDYYQLFWRTEARVGAVFISAGLVCWLRDAKRPLLRGPTVIATLVVGVALQTRWVPDLLKYTLGTALLALSVTHLAVAPARLRRQYENPLLVSLGVYSYSIYLWQQAFLAASDHASKAVCLVGALLTGVISYHVVENPARRFLNARWAGGR